MKRQDYENKLWCLFYDAKEKCDFIAALKILKEIQALG